MTQVPSDKPTPPSRAEVAGQQAVGKSLDDQLRWLRSTKTEQQPPRHDNEGLPHFVNLSRRLGEALLEVAMQQVTRAENNLNEVKQWTENMEHEAQKKWEEMQDLERKFEDYRSYLLQANDRFNGGKK